MENTNNILAANIQKYRKRCGITQEELAQKLGVTFQAVSKWENAKSAPDILFLPTMADLFGCSIDELFSRTVEINNRNGLCNDLAWEDDDVIRIFQAQGKKILKSQERNSLIEVEFPKNCNETTRQYFKVEVLGNMYCDASVNGDVVCQGNMYCDASVNGDVVCQGNLQCYQINGNISGGCSADGSIEVGGNVSGGCQCGNSIKICGNLSGGCNCGDSISAGGSISGGCNCGDNITCGGNITGNIECGSNVSVSGDIEATTIRCESICCDTLKCDRIDSNVLIK